MPKEVRSILTTLGVLLLSCFLIFACVAGQGTSTSVAHPHAVATMPPTQTPAPTPTLTITERTSAQILALIAPSVQHATAMYSGGVIAVTDVWVNGVSNNQLGLVYAKTEILGVMRTLYTRWHHPLAEVDVVIEGPDRIGNLAAAYLFATTAARFNWPKLVPETAWQQYDFAESSLTQE